MIGGTDAAPPPAAKPPAEPWADVIVTDINGNSSGLAEVASTNPNRVALHIVSICAVYVPITAFGPTFILTEPVSFGLILVF